MIKKASKVSKAPEVLCGDVAHARVRHGTGSEHEALVLRTDEGDELILQRIGANPFKDPDGEKLVGERVTVEGYRLGKVFRYLSAVKEDR